MPLTIEKQDAIFIDFSSDNIQTGLLNLCLPLINSTVEELKKRSNTRFTNRFVNSHEVVIYNLLGSLLTLSHKTLISSYKFLKKKGLFPEATENERLKSFSDHLKEPEIRSFILEQYPLLEKWLINEASVWLKQTCKLAERLEKDYKIIQEKFFNNEALGEIDYITYGMGDRHRGGQSVAMITFQSGKKLLYKPRNLAIDIHFRNFLNEIDKDVQLGFITPKLIQFETYGWVEFIAYTSCTKVSEINDYYERMGAYLAVLYTLEATDFHYENIIAHGAHPVLIDLESFFHPYFPTEGTETNEATNQSVLRTGLLPSKSAPVEGATDISGLTDVEQKEGLLPNMILKMEGDNIEYVRDKGVLLGGNNIPILNGEKVSISKKHMPYFKSGFKKTYNYVVKNKEKVKKELLNFANDEVRVLFRNTVAYVHLLEESTHPKIMESVENAQEHFNILAEKIRVNKIAKHFVPHEAASLMKREVPLFTTKVNSRHLWVEEDVYLENFFESTGIETVSNRIDLMCEADLKRQLWIIDASFEINVSEEHIIPENKRINPREAKVTPTQKELLDESLKVANYIENTIHLTKDSCSWLVFKPINLEGTSYRIAESFYDLFSGMPGEILYFAYLYEIMGDEKFKKIAVNAVTYLQEKLQNSKDAINVLGFYTGWGSIIDLYTKLAILWKDDSYLEKIEKLYEEIDFEAYLEKDQDFSLVKGAAGFMVANINYYNQTTSAKALELAEKSARYLLNKAQKTDDYIAWKIISKVPISGLSHGASGFALAFAKLYNATKDDSYLTIVEKILNYEKTLFVEAQQNWQDCRDIITQTFPNQIMCATTWSHGAAGIGLARLEMLKLGIPFSNLKEDLEIALQTTLKNGFGGKHSLSAGDFGNLELLLQYATYYKDENVMHQLQNILRSLMDDISENSWKIGTKRIQSLGLMTGVTGIGYQFLRMAYPNKVPSLLVAS
ncbi:type 2 lantibiotic biosynthesis protein LanM [Kordia periserrulae]|uniref:Type 2 lantibiotic biosynthesis protein LanM n=1 Tax=Kordia periserrulae TaxID=701523 RepID=A0A2T6C332_9FLAO|nr:type 2 lanthipeptide synthetase LanM family protein [Kordia periserrulae]PTX62729.1 type 2 lantibiotic biosynthesis protein LanM [Kordia periserrulae]